MKNNQDSILRSQWFINAFADLATSYIAGTIGVFEAIESANERLRYRLRADLIQRGLRSLLRRDEDILQQFWLRLLAGGIIQSHDPDRAGPWPMIYRLFRFAAWDISTKQQSGQLSLALAAEVVDRNSPAAIQRVDDLEMIELINVQCRSLTPKLRVALHRKYPVLADTVDVPAETGTNESVDRHRALRRLRRKIDVDRTDR